MYKVLSYIFAKLLIKIQVPAISNSFVHRSAKVQSGSNVTDSIFGRYSYCGKNCNINRAKIGSFCSISHNVNIGGADHPLEFVSTSPVFLSHGRTSVNTKFATHDYLPRVETVVGNDVWIGAGVFIKAGVMIGNGAVVGMGAVVTKDVPAYSVVVGNPAKVIRMRFPETTISKLLELNWWDWDETQLKVYGEYFNNPNELLKQVTE